MYLNTSIRKEINIIFFKIFIKPFGAPPGKLVVLGGWGGGGWVWGAFGITWEM